MRQLESINFKYIDSYHKISRREEKEKTYCNHAATVLLDDSCNPYKVPSILNSIRRGEIGVLTVAGGQALPRLGWSGPKGTYPATPY